jgi:4-amino-4-deoxy-L-arabinose transferase-like glycosyltransferase
VTQTDNASNDPRAPSRAARFGWLVLILATLYVCYFRNLGAIGFVGPDEPRYAWISRAMVETGEWVTPRLYGKPWFEKPALYYWEAALSFKVFGVSEVTARLPCAIAALLATLGVAWLAWQLYGAETALWLLLLLPTTVAMIGFSHAAATDMPFAAALTLAMICAAILLGLVGNGDTPILPRTPWLALLSFGFFLGLAVLAKGPAAIVLAGGAVFLWALLTKRWRDAFRCLHLLAIASFCLTALPWYILCARRNPDFFRVFIIEHNFKRYLTPEFQHIQPFWFYVPILLLAVFPWTVLMLVSVKQFFDVRARGDSQRAQYLFLLCWPAFTFLFFTASRSKLPGYVLPAVPPLVLLFTQAFARTTKWTSRRWLGLALGASFVAAALVFLAASKKLPTYIDVQPSPLSVQIATIAFLGGAVILLLGFLRQQKAALLLAVGLSLVLVERTNALLANIDPGLTARGSLLEAARTWPDFHLESAATWQLRRSLLYQLDFYAHSELPEWAPSQSRPTWLLVEPFSQAKVASLGFSCPHYSVYPAIVCCKSSASVGGLGALGGLGGDGHIGSGTDR